jgi:Spy/CpxP family protein refolding chaperone
MGAIMSMRLPILMAAFCFLAAATAQAEQPTAAEHTGQGTRAQERFAELQSRLKLTPEQTEKLRPIIQQETDELRAVREKYASDKSPTTRQAMQSEMKGIHERYEGQIAAILTPEQMGEWNKIKEERKSKADSRSAQAEERIAELQSRLKLTPEQTDRLRPILQQERAELQAVREKYASDTSRKGKKDKMRDMKSIQEKYSGQIAAVLTPEQIAEWKKIKEERKQELKEKHSR